MEQLKFNFDGITAPVTPPEVVTDEPATVKEEVESLEETTEEETSAEAVV